MADQRRNASGLPITGTQGTLARSIPARIMSACESTCRWVITMSRRPASNSSLKIHGSVTLRQAA